MCAARNRGIKSSTRHLNPHEDRPLRVAGSTTVRPVATGCSTRTRLNLAAPCVKGAEANISCHSRSGRSARRTGPIGRFPLPDRMSHSVTFTPERARCSQSARCNLRGRWNVRAATPGRSECLIRSLGAGRNPATPERPTPGAHRPSTYLNEITCTTCEYRHLPKFPTKQAAAQHIRRQTILNSQDKRSGTHPRSRNMLKPGPCHRSLRHPRRLVKRRFSYGQSWRYLLIFQPAHGWIGSGRPNPRRTTAFRGEHGDRSTLSCSVHCSLRIPELPLVRAINAS